MEKLAVHNPWNGNLIETLPLLSEQDVSRVLDNATEAYNTPKRHLPMHARVDILESFAQKMQAHRAALVSLAIAEGGKPHTDTEAEFDRALDGIGCALAAMREWGGQEVPMGYTRATAGRTAFTQYEPMGVVAAYSAFNHPINLFIHQVVPAVAVGTPIIFKPAPTTPLTGIRLSQLLYEAGLPAVWCQTITISNELAGKLAADARLANLNFIGAGQVGWMLRNKLAAGTRITLEHGGVAPVIVDKDVPLDQVIPALIRGSFYHAGQVCVSVQRVYVHREKASAFADALAAQAHNVVVGDPNEPTTLVGPLIRQKEATRIHEWVGEAMQHGAQLLCGGQPIPEHNTYAPTVLYNPSAQSTIMQQEVFGPVVCVIPYDTLTDAIAQANTLPYHFQAAIFTNTLSHALQAAKTLHAATVLVNDSTAFRADWMPFAGEGQSGLGTGGIRYTMESYCRRKLWVMRALGSF